MVSGQWNRQTVKALWQLTARYWKSEEKKSAWLYLLGIVDCGPHHGGGVHDPSSE